jgi:hypothetical protein
MPTKIKLHQRFLDVFTSKELKEIVKSATAVGEKCIIISTTDYFFELSADIGDKLDIYCVENKNNTQLKLTKDEFIKLYKNSPLIEMQHITIEN